MKMITRAELIGWEMPEDMISWFVGQYPEGVARYQNVLDEFASQDRCDWANRLMDVAGTEPGRVTVFSPCENAKHVFAAGDLSALGSVRVSGFVRVAGDTDVAHDFHADAGIVCAGSVTVGGSLQTADRLTIQGSTKVGGSIVAKKGMVVRETVTVGDDLRTEAGNIDAENGLEVGGTIWANGFVRADLVSVDQALVATGDVTLHGGMHCEGEIRITGNFLLLGATGWSHLEAKGDLVVKGNLQCEGAIRAARIEIGGDLRCDRFITAESDIVVERGLVCCDRISSWHGHIKVGASLSAGGRILAGREIIAGEIFIAPEDAIYAGTLISPEHWASEGRVIVPHRPDRVASGHWIPAAPEDLGQSDSDAASHPFTACN